MRVSWQKGTYQQEQRYESEHKLREWEGLEFKMDSISN
jgi:hypothetical protein